MVEYEADHIMVEGWERTSSQLPRRGGSNIGLYETREWGYRFFHTSWWYLESRVGSWTEPTTERGTKTDTTVEIWTKTKTEEGIRSRNEVKKNYENQRRREIPRKTRTKGERNTYASAYEDWKTQSEGKEDTKTNAAEGGIKETKPNAEEGAEPELRVAEIPKPMLEEANLREQCNAWRLMCPGTV